MAEIVEARRLKYRVYESKRGTWKAYIRWGKKSWMAHKATKDAVLQAIRDHADSLNGGIVNTKLSLTEAQIFDEAKRTLEPFGVTLAEAAHYFATHHKGMEKEITAADAVKEFIGQKEKDGFSEAYLHALKVHLNVFVERFGTNKLTSITSGTLNEWLRAMTGSGRSRNNYRSILITFFRWAKDCNYLPNGQPVAPEKTQKAKEGTSPITVLSPETLKRLVNAASDHTEALRCIMFGAHTGIRTAELCRLNWTAVNIEAGHIEIASEITKTAARRLVPLNDTFKAWLRKKGEDSGPIITLKRVDLQTAAVAEKAGMKWIRNALRHSYISYRLAEVQNAAQVALEAGNSPQKIFSNYLSIKLPDGRLITKELAAKWFAVTAKRAPRKSA